MSRKLSERQIHDLVEEIYHTDGKVNFLASCKSNETFIPDKLNQHHHALDQLVASIFAGPTPEIVPHFRSLDSLYQTLPPNWKKILQFAEYYALHKNHVAKPRKILGRHYHVHPHLATQWVNNTLGKRGPYTKAVLLLTTLLHDVPEEAITPHIRAYKQELKDSVPLKIFEGLDLELFSSIRTAAESDHLYIVTDKRDPHRYGSYKTAVRKRASLAESPLQVLLSTLNSDEKIEALDRYLLPAELVDQYVDEFTQQILLKEESLIDTEIQTIKRELRTCLGQLQILSNKEISRISTAVGDTVYELTRPGSEGFDESCLRLVESTKKRSVKTAKELARRVKGADCLANAYDLDRRTMDPVLQRFKFFEDHNLQKRAQRTDNNDLNGSDPLFRQKRQVRNFLLRANRTPDHKKAERQVELIEQARYLIAESDNNIVPILEISSAPASTWGYRLLEKTLYDIARANRINLEKSTLLEESTSESWSKTDRHATHMDSVERIYRTGKGHIYLSQLGEFYADKSMPHDLQQIRKHLAEVSLKISDDVSTETVSLYLGRGTYTDPSGKSITLIPLDTARTCWQQFKEYRSQGGLEVITRDGGSGYDVFTPLIQQRVKGNKERMRRNLKSQERNLRASIALRGLSETYLTTSNFYLKYDKDPDQKIEVGKKETK